MNTSIDSWRLVIKREFNKACPKYGGAFEFIVFARAEGDSKKYRQESYDVMGIIYTLEENANISLLQKGVDIRRYLNVLIDGGDIYKLSCFDKYKEQQRIDNEQFDFDLDVVDGVMSCSKCGSSKVFQHHKQTRSSDEATTIFYTCANKSCRQKWRVN